jgi:serine/threonine protein kinase
MVASPRYCPACGAANGAQAAFCSACGQALSTNAQSRTGLLIPNHLLKQRYRILAQVGRGGFGAVYRAEDVQLGNRLVAIKEMSQYGFAPQELQQAIDAFQHEAIMLAGLRHPNLPRIYEQFAEIGRQYLVMDFIEGQTLETYHSEHGGSLPVEEVLQIGLQLCNVLDYLHSSQPPIIFRDLKPENVMIGQDGQLSLIDFGIARHFKPGQSRDTVAFGSPGYAAPEQYGKAQTTPLRHL